jgi:RNA polymerase-binding transcription factor DksA
MSCPTLHDHVLPGPARPRTDLRPHLPELRAALEEQRRFRVEQLAGLAGARATGVDDARDEVTRTLRAGAASALVDIEVALHLMDNGGYGRCQRCGDPLPLERLEVLPSVALCTTCQRTAAPTG